MKCAAVLLPIAFLCLTGSGGSAFAGSPAPVPTGFSGLGVFVGDGEFVPGTPNPDVPGCDVVPSFCDGAHFWQEVVHFTPDEVEAERLAARSFLAERYGIDVDAAIDSGEITWLEGYVDPRLNYRARVLPNQLIHRYGWEVHDLAFLLIANVSIELGGEFPRMVIPPGTLISKGFYVIQKSQLVERDGHRVLVNMPGRIVLRYQSGGPILPSADDRIPIVANCEITSSPWGRGVAIAGTFPFQGTDLLKQGTRNVLTFDGGDGLGDYVGVYNDPDLVILEP